MKIICENISKNFGSKKVIKNFSKKFKKKSYAILGKNGSGKSTLLKIIANLLIPSSGIIDYKLNKKNLVKENIIKNIFFSAPYQELINELSLEEFLNFHFKFREKRQSVKEQIDYFGLNKYKNNLISDLSSGLEQKLRLLIAFNTKSEFLFLDEPTTNLDKDGKSLYKEIYKSILNEKGIIIATNDRNDIIDRNTTIINLA
tara:strand:+ start:563 stop:1165 length:603 start_codon:yes stop_codon:yes gene_type:complete